MEEIAGTNTEEEEGTIIVTESLIDVKIWGFGEVEKRLRSF